MNKNKSNMEILKDKLQQEIRKTLQSVVYYGYDIISAELDLLKAFDKYAQLQSLPKEPTPLRDELIRKITLSFWFHWYNHPGGTNTEQGFDDWWSKNRDEYLNSKSNSK